MVCRVVFGVLASAVGILELFFYPGACDDKNPNTLPALSLCDSLGVFLIYR